MRVAKHVFDIRSVMDVALWEQVQDQLSKLAGVSVITVDMNGIPVTKSSGQTEFCRLMRMNPVTRKRCCRCDALAGLEAMRMKRPYIYLCHCGIVDVAIPVIVEEQYLGAVLFGQVRVPNNDSHQKLERLVNEFSSFNDGDEGACQELLTLFEKLPEMEYSYIEKVADLVCALVNYIVERVVKANNERQNYEWIMSFDDSRQDGSDFGILELTKPESGGDEEPLPVPRTSVIYPAVAYIRDHLKEPITMKDMAILCHLSPSYFSRLFGRELGENFASYVNRKKVQLAKSYLRETGKSVAQIASELSYQDSSHFINLFKRFEGITPQVYRQYNYK